MGISLLMSHKGKLLERLIFNRLKTALKDAIPANQFGFTENCKTQDAILVSRIILAINAIKNHTGLVRGYIDLTKAYDKLNREILWKILRLYGVRTGGNCSYNHRLTRQHSRRSCNSMGKIPIPPSHSIVD